MCAKKTRAAKERNLRVFRRECATFAHGTIHASLPYAAQCGGGARGHSMASALYPAISGTTSEAVNPQAQAAPHHNGYSHGGNVQDQPLPAGWQEAVDTASGNVYYQHHLTHATQRIRPTEQNQGMVTGSNFGQLVVDINGGAFGMLPGIPGMNTINNQMLARANSAILGSSGTAHLGLYDQTNDPNQKLEEDASLYEKCMAVVSFLSEVGQRLAFIIPALLPGGTASSGLYLYTIDLLLLVYYASKAKYQEPRYCPGCLYNDLHVLIKGKKLKPYFVSIKTKRFSATKKFIVGIASIATLVNVVDGVSEIWCAWDKGGGNILSYRSRITRYGQ